MDSEPLLTTDITRIRKAQLKEILLKYNIGTTNETTEAVRKKASIIKQSLQLARAKPHLQDFITGVINQTHVLDAQQKLQFPILAELERIALYSLTSSSSDDNAYTPADASDSDSDCLPDNSTAGNPIKSEGNKALITTATADNPSGPHKPHENITQNIPIMTENLPLISAGSFNGLNSENATDFIEKYLLAADSNNWSDQSKLKLFPNHLGGIAINWYKNYKTKAPNNTIPNWETLKTDFLQAFTPLAQCSSLSAILEHKLQGPNETTLSYLLDITTTCRRYDPDIAEPQIISYILRGLKPEILQKVLTKQNDTLDRLEKNLKEAELLEIKLKQNLALYSKLSNNQSTSYHSSDHKELSQLQQQVKVLTDLVATILPNKPQHNNWSPGPGHFRHNRSHQHLTRGFNQSQQQNTPQQIRFRTPQSTAQSQPRSTSAQYAQSPKFCNYCKTNTHLTEFCWFRNHRPDHPLYTKPIVCRYCKQQGHVIQQCTKSRFYNPHYSIDLHQQTPEPASSSNSSENGPVGGSKNHDTPRS